MNENQLEVSCFWGQRVWGKTETAKALAEYLFNDEKAMVRIDMSEYMEPHSVARLLGVPPGYVGYEEGGQLTEAVRRKPYTVILLDEIEKAHPQVFNVFLQLFDDGRITDGKGRVVNFTNTVIIMTSNLGSDIIQSYKGKQDTEMEGKVLEIVYKFFHPEFLNRLDQIVVYHSLTEEMLRKIVDLQLSQVTARLAKQRMYLTFTDGIQKYLSEVGFDPTFGARPLKRVIQDQILDELALQIIEKKIQPDAKVKVDYKNGKTLFQLAN